MKLKWKDQDWWGRSIWKMMNPNPVFPFQMIVMMKTQRNVKVLFPIEEVWYFQKLTNDIVSQLEEIKEDGSSCEKAITPIQEENEEDIPINLNKTTTFSNNGDILDTEDDDNSISDTASMISRFDFERR